VRRLRFFGLETAPDSMLKLVRKSAADQAMDGVVYARRTLYAGFTTVIDLGGENDAVFAVRDAANANKFPAPHVIASGEYITATGGGGDVQGYRPEVMAVLHDPNQCSGADECARVVRQQIQRGADIIKVIATGSVISETATGVGNQFSDAELEAIVTTAHRMGKRVTYGTDTGVSAHGLNTREFALLAQAGVSPLDAIRMATVWGADHAGIGDEAGALRPGYRADIIAVEGDPTTDTHTLEHVRFVMKDGIVYFSGGEPAGQL